MIKTIFYYILFILAIEVIFVSIATGFDQTLISKILTLTYFLILLLVFIVACLLLILLNLFLFDFLRIGFLFEKIFEAISFIALSVFASAFETFIEIILFPLRLFGETVYNQAVDLVMAIIPEKTISFKDSISGLYEDVFGYGLIGDYDFIITVGGGIAGGTLISIVYSAFKKVF